MALSLSIEHPRLDDFIERLAIQPNQAERARIMRAEMLPWLYDYIPGVAIGATLTIAGVGPKVGEWPLIPEHMRFHRWEYVTRARQPARRAGRPFLTDYQWTAKGRGRAFAQRRR